MTAMTAVATTAELQALAEQAVTWAYPLYEMLVAPWVLIGIA